MFFAYLENMVAKFLVCEDESTYNRVPGIRDLHQHESLHHQV